MIRRSAASLVICLMAVAQAFASLQSPDPASDEVYRPGNGVSTPTLLKDAKPQYTAGAMRAKIEGSVLMECVIQTDGTVRDDLKVVRSLDTKYGLDDEAVKAALQWRFQPGIKDGKPVPVRVTIEMAFTLNLKTKKRGAR